uniref:Uncharacterized protein n=1 Tax=Panthera leo TaxID=9689 RepID=A0A8C9D6R0_PANLE
SDRSRETSSQSIGGVFAGGWPGPAGCWWAMRSPDTSSTATWPPAWTWCAPWRRPMAIWR